MSFRGNEVKIYENLLEPDVLHKRKKFAEKVI